jgi:hypothetical protein
MNSRLRYAFAPALFLLGGSAATGCYTPPARTSGSSTSSGLSVSIAGQFCEESLDPYWVGNEVVQLRMRLLVRNEGNTPVDVQLDRLRLSSPDGIRAEPVAFDGPVVVQANESKVVSVRFMNRGSLQCRQPMELDVADVATSGARHIPLAPIAFTARST